MTERSNEHASISARPDDEPLLPVDHRAQVHERLLVWYGTHGRATLPWRHTRDPYAVLVAEVMLQQTQVERVLPKYHAFLSRFPTLAELAAAPTSEVIKAWAGLGYNLRAVRLQAVARQAMERYGGTLPNSLDELLALAGIGRYTAGAVACFAFGLPIATVDTNIRRVLWRVLRGIEPAVWPSGTRAARDALALAEWALPTERAYDWQQALMDLGATICLSRRPLCERCPLADCCAAYAETARIVLFPSGADLTRLRDERSANESLPPSAAVLPGSPGADPATARVAETRAGYNTAGPPTRPDHVGATHASPGVDSPAASPTAATPTRRRKEPAFERSSRYYRGRAVAALRALAPGQSLSLADLGPQVKDDYTLADLPWLRTLLAGLAHDGLARLCTDAAGIERAALPE